MEGLGKKAQTSGEWNCLEDLGEITENPIPKFGILGKGIRNPSFFFLDLHYSFIRINERDRGQRERQGQGGYK